MGVAALSSVVAAVGFTHSVGGHDVPNLSAYHAAFLTAALVALLAAVLSLRVDDGAAASTMTRRTTLRRPRPATREVAASA